jgi:hypothetical protein
MTQPRASCRHDLAREAYVLANDAEQKARSSDRDTVPVLSEITSNKLSSPLGNQTTRSESAPLDSDDMMSVEDHPLDDSTCSSP